jgi:hypothetical protein
LHFLKLYFRYRYALLLNIKPQNIKPQNTKPQNIKPQNIKPRNIKSQNTRKTRPVPFHPKNHSRILIHFQSSHISHSPRSPSEPPTPLPAGVQAHHPALQVSHVFLEYVLVHVLVLELQARHLTFQLLQVVFLALLRVAQRVVISRVKAQRAFNSGSGVSWYVGRLACE